MEMPSVNETPEKCRACPRLEGLHAQYGVLDSATREALDDAMDEQNAMRGAPEIGTHYSYARSLDTGPLRRIIEDGQDARRALAQEAQLLISACDGPLTMRVKSLGQETLVTICGSRATPLGSVTETAIVQRKPIIPG